MPLRARLRRLVDRSRPSSRWLLLGVVALALFAILAARLHLRPAISAPIASALFLAGAAAGLRRLRFDYGTVAIVVAGLALYLVYLGYTDYGERNYDGGAQLEYIKYILDHRALPPASQCLICHHPPAYYALGAACWAFFDATKLAPPILGLQLVSLLLTLAFIVFGVLLARRVADDRRQVRLAAALLVFWPYAVHNSVRVHNDTLACTAMVIALHFALKWWQENRARDLYWSAAFSALAILTKSSGIVLAALLGLLLVIRLFRGRDPLRVLARGVVTALVLAAALGLNAARKEIDKKPPTDLCTRVLGSACAVSKGALMPNEPVRYLVLEPNSYLTEPYVLDERPNANREWFWNHLLKSSLLGTHNKVADRETAYEMNRGLAAAMSDLLLAMIAFTLFGLALVDRRVRRRHAVELLAIALFLAFLIGFRALLPAAHHTDFRHVFPILALMASLYSAIVADLRLHRPRLATIGNALAISMLALSILYFLPKYDWIVRHLPREIERPLSSVSRVVPEGTPWDHDRNLLIEGNHTVLFRLDPPRDVREIDASFDSNDRYEIVVASPTDSRRLVVGPARKGRGLARYIEPLSPPVTGATSIRVHPLSGDRAYSLGHLIAR